MLGRSLLNCVFCFGFAENSKVGCDAHVSLILATLNGKNGKSLILCRNVCSGWVSLWDMSSYFTPYFMPRFCLSKQKSQVMALEEWADD